MGQDRLQNPGRSSFDDYKEEPLGLLENKPPIIEELPSGTLTKRQKVLSGILAGLVLVLLLVVGFGAKSFFAVPVPGGQERVDAENAKSIEPVLSSEEEDLRSKDTDEDGVNDYEELNIYITSPYLADSDSDDLNDKQEIDNGTDPNCPTGKTCFNSFVTSDTEDSSTVSPIATDLPTPEELRDLLRLSGKFSEADIVAFSDDELLKFYRDTIGDQPLKTPVSIETKTKAEDYTPAELRIILIENGVPENIVSSLSDEELLSFFKQAWKEANKEVTSN